MNIVLARIDDRLIHDRLVQGYGLHPHHRLR